MKALAAPTHRHGESVFDGPCCSLLACRLFSTKTGEERELFPRSVCCSVKDQTVNQAVRLALAFSAKALKVA